MDHTTSYLLREDLSMKAKFFEILARVTIGYVFIESGLLKLKDMSPIVSYFESLGIPYPYLNAHFAAGTELICGLLILIGLCARLASIPLIVIMLVALRTAKWEDITGVSSVLGMIEFLYIVILFGLIAYGAKFLSVDSFLGRSTNKLLQKAINFNFKD
jgi:putative oxidoreductase